MSEQVPPGVPPMDNPKAAAAAAKAYAKANRPWYKKKRWIGAIVLVAIFGITAASGGGSETGDDKPTAAERATEDREAAETTPAAEEPTAEEPAPEEPAEPELTSGQENAVAAAENYLSFAGFSRTGLIRQLVQGDQYSEADATFAVDYLKIDYKKQAVRAAENYLQISAFSRDGLIRQLVQGDGYSQENAAHGADTALAN